MPSAYDQSRYQIRFEWGADGLARLAASDVVVVVDVLSYSSRVTDAVADGASVPLAEGVEDRADAALVAEAASASGAQVLIGSLRNAAAVAQAALAEQQRRAARTSVAIIAVGESTSGGTRFAVEDQLGAGAIIDALGALGIDHTSPESAAACEAFRGLRAAVRHLLTASASGQLMLERGGRDEALAAAQLDVTAAVPVLRDGVFAAA
jgi:2-phosphosulfolactate phosphatase